MPSTAALGQLHWLSRVQEELVGAEGPLPERADVVIVGGGYVGTATAYWLGTLGVEAVLVERRGIAAGATGRNAGFIAPGLGQPFGETVALYGREAAIERLNFTRRGRDLALSLIQDLDIECELELCGGLTLAASPDEWEALKASGAALGREGFPVETLTREDLRDHLDVPVPERFLGGLYNPETLLVNPAKLSHGIARAAQRLGARLHLSTEVLALTDLPDGRIAVETSRGEVIAGRVVLATNAWAPLLVSFLKDRITPVRGQIFATEPARRAFRRAMSTNYGYEYWSQRADGAIILGGARWSVPDMDVGYYAEEVNPAVHDALYRFLTETFPELRGVHVARRWSGIMGFSRDGYPFIGPVPGRERLLVAAGYTGHGGPYFAIAGKAIAEFIARGRTDEPLHHFSLNREL